MMTTIEIAKKINSRYLFVYASTYGPTTLIYSNGLIKEGFFQNTSDSESLMFENTYRFVEFGEKTQKFRETNDIKYVSLIDGKDLIDVIYPFN